jgi:hypothetical protein
MPLERCVRALLPAKPSSPFCELIVGQTAEVVQRDQSLRGACRADLGGRASRTVGLLRFEEVPPARVHRLRQA